DCTGHGVPGAFLSIVGNNFLEQGLNEPSVNSPADALNYLNSGLYKTLRQENSPNINDGMDIAFCALDSKAGKLIYSGAKNPAYIVRANDGSLQKAFPDFRYTLNDNESLGLLELKADRHAIGSLIDGKPLPYTDIVVDVRKGDMIY